MSSTGDGSPFYQAAPLSNFPFRVLYHFDRHIHGIHIALYKYFKLFFLKMEHAYLKEYPYAKNIMELIENSIWHT